MTETNGPGLTSFRSYVNGAFEHLRVDRYSAFLTQLFDINTGMRKLLRAKGAICYQTGIYFKKGTNKNERELTYI